MSVINRMLSELDARRADPPAAAAGEAIRATVPVRAASSPRRLQGIVLLGAVAISAAAFGNWPALLGSAAPVPKAASFTGEVASAVSAQADAPAVIAKAPDSAAAAQSLPAGKTANAARRVTHAVQGPGLKPTSAHLARLGPMGAQAAQREPAPSLHSAEAATPMAASKAAAPVEKSGIEKKMVSMTAAQRAALAYRQATEFAATGHSSQAIDKALEALRGEPDHVAARQLAAVLLFEKNRFDEAGAVLREGLQRTPREPQLSYLLARLHVEGGDLARALAVLAQAEGLSADGHGLRAGVLARLTRYADAAKSYEAAVRLDPENASWWLGLGVALDAEGHAADAKQAFQRARAIGTLQGELLGYVDQKLAN